jgi:hypothetical protein
LNFIDFPKDCPVRREGTNAVAGVHNSAPKLHDAPSCIIENTGDLTMLGLIARWGHNVLLTTTGLLTIAMVVAWAR